MLEIKDTRVYGLEESIVASGYAKTTQPYNYAVETDDIRWHDEPSKFSKHEARAKRLVHATKNSPNVKCHDNFLTGIIVQCDIKYPQFISPEMQRYHWFQIITSQSKMHKLTAMKADTVCNEWTPQASVDALQKEIDNYNALAASSNPNYSATFFGRHDNVSFVANSRQEALRHQFYICTCAVPGGLELWMRVSLNYKQIQTMYFQRLNHKLYDWEVFCHWVESLPYAKELIIGEDSL